MAAPEQEYEGSCSCGGVGIRMSSAPLVVHCCHCRYCQRQTGTAFALNALVEADRVAVTRGEPEQVDTPSPSGKGQTISRCPDCRVALYSRYGSAGGKLYFVRVGALDDAALFEPDVHIHTDSKQPWVVLPEGATSYPGYYPAKEVWSESSLARSAVLFGK